MSRYNRNNHSNMYRSNGVSAAFCALRCSTAAQLAELLHALFLVIISMIIFGILVIV